VRLQGLAPRRRGQGRPQVGRLPAWRAHSARTSPSWRTPSRLQSQVIWTALRSSDERAGGALCGSFIPARSVRRSLPFTDREHFAALFVNERHHVVGAHIAAIGAQHAIASVDVCAIFRAALAACANAIVLGHNHPFGDPTSTSRNLATTAKIVRAGSCPPVLDQGSSRVTRSATTRCSTKARCRASIRDPEARWEVSAARAPSPQRGARRPRRTRGHLPHPPGRATSAGIT
jgi:RadC-like JAB domain